MGDLMDLSASGTSRRTLLKSLALGAAVAAVPATASAASNVRRAASETLTGPAPWWLVQPLEAGSAVGNGWRVGSLGTVVAGAAVLELHHTAGGVARVHLCLHDGEPRGMAHTAMFDLILMDGGDGDRPTDEGIGRVLLDLARRIRINEVSPGGDLRPIARMLTHPERVEAFGPENLT